MNIVHLMSKIVRADVIKCGYDVMCKAYDGIHMPPVTSYTVGVMSLTERV